MCVIIFTFKKVKSKQLKAESFNNIWSLSFN
ncbi:MAG: hypothetical protein ACI8ZA_002687 [Gammaproteobacteria bacterium]